MDGDALKQNLGMNMERGNTIRDVKVKVEAMTGVPVFGVALGQFAGFFVDAYVATHPTSANRVRFLEYDSL